MATNTQVNTTSPQTLINKALTNPVLNGAVCGSDPVAPLGVCTKQYADSLLTSLLPTGVMFPYGGASPPTGYLLCDGSNVSRTAFAQLFSVIGVTYGTGDGSTTFGLPDRRGRTSVGAGTGPGLTARTRGQKFGTETETAPLPAHAHTFSAGQNAGSGVFAAGADKGIVSGTTSTSGSGGVHNNVQPSQADTWIIKT